ncbi:hypothetical protein CHS0354_033613, partial [Potamilus streckersoni]
RQAEGSIQWRCSVWRKQQIRYASVTQKEGVFNRAFTRHNHPSDPLVAKSVRMKTDVRRWHHRLNAKAGRYKLREAKLETSQTRLVSEAPLLHQRREMYRNKDVKIFLNCETSTINTNS